MEDEIHPLTSDINKKELMSQGRMTNSDAGGNNESFMSRTDTFEKTGVFLTAVNIIKSFLGLGILAAPSGFKMSGVIPATVLILLNASLSVVTVSLQTRTKEHYGPRVKTYSDLGHACFGNRGRLTLAVTIILNQIMCCIGYVMFFMEQML